MGSHGYMSPPNEAGGEGNREPSGHEMTRHAPFTTLDRVLIDAVVDARQGIVGALNDDGRRRAFPASANG